MFYLVMFYLFGEIFDHAATSTLITQMFFL